MMANLRRVGALALNTFREAVRDKVLYSILFFAGGVILLAEPLTVRLVVASAVMLGGIAIVLLQRQKSAGGTD